MTHIRCRGIGFVFLGISAAMAFGQTPLLEESLRDGTLPAGWFPAEVSFQTNAGGYARLDATNAALATPAFDASAHTSVQVAFGVAKYGSGGDGPVTVEYRTDAGSAWAKAGDSPTPTNSSTYLSALVDIATVSTSMQVRFTRPDSPSDKRMRDVVISGVGTSGVPSLLVSEPALSGFSYAAGSGPSAGRSYTLSGSALTGTGNITVTAPADFEISTAAESGYGASLDLPFAGGQVTGQPVTLHVRMAAGLAPGTHEGTIIHAGGGVSTPPGVALDGFVSLGTPLTQPATAVEWSRFTANWTAVPGATGYRLAVSTRPEFDAGGSESFEQHTAGGTYGSGSYTGDQGVVWHYVASRNDAGYPIDGKSILMRYSNENSRVYCDPVPGGIADFSCRLRKGFTAAGNRQVELFVNDVSQGVSDAFDDTDVRTFAVSNINVSGDVVVRVDHVTGSQVVIDDLSWTRYPSAAAPGYADAPVEASGTGVTGLDRDTLYYYRVRATAGEMAGEWSDPRAVRTASEPPPFLFYIQ